MPQAIAKSLLDFSKAAAAAWFCVTTQLD